MKALIWLPTDSIHINPEYQDLFPPLSMNVYQELRDDIRKVGILVPLILESDDRAYCVLAGHHRLKAAKELGLEQVPCEIVETQEEQISALFDNIHRRQLSVSELKRLKEEEEDWRKRCTKHIPASLQSLCEELPLERILPPNIWSQLISSPPAKVNSITKSFSCTLNKLRARAAQSGMTDTLNAPRSHSLAKQATGHDLEELRKTAVNLSKEVQKRNQVIEKLQDDLQAHKRKMTDAEALLHAYQMQDPITITPGVIVDGFQTLIQLVRLLLEWTSQLPNASDDFHGTINRAIAQLRKILDDRGQHTGNQANLRVVQGRKNARPVRL